jgi:hypothetical protein
MGYRELSENNYGRETKCRSLTLKSGFGMTVVGVGSVKVQSAAWLRACSRIFTLALAPTLVAPAATIFWKSS